MKDEQVRVRIDAWRGGLDVNVDGGSRDVALGLLHELLPAVTEVDRIVRESIDGRTRANTHERDDVEVIERCDDGQDEEQGTEQPQR